jgi:catechol 2,3-dioxygenase-like lactoylglutathione lyase family enzyme
VKPTLYMTELRVADLERSVAWYEALGLRVVMRDDGFALLEAESGRLALKVGTPGPGGVVVHFQVAELPPGEVKVSDEGYRRVRLSDPDGYAVVLFVWEEQAMGRGGRGWNADEEDQNRRPDLV